MSVPRPSDSGQEHHPVPRHQAARQALPRWARWLSYSLMFGLPAGALGAVQVALSVHENLADRATQAAECARNPQFYCDGTYVDRVTLYYAFGSLAVLIVLLSVYWYVVAFLVAHRGKTEWMSVGGTLSAPLVGGVIYGVATVVGARTGNYRVISVDPIANSGAMFFFCVLLIVFLFVAWMSAGLGFVLGAESVLPRSPHVGR